MTDFVEMFRHWNAGRSQVQINEALNIDRKTIRKYLAPALAEGLDPVPEPVEAIGTDWAAAVQLQHAARQAVLRLSGEPDVE
ncbi:MAG TPA: integrase [Mycobacterium sp.]